MNAAIETYGEKQMDMIEQLLLDYQIPAGDEATLRLRDQYATALVRQASDVETQAIALLEGGKAINPMALYELLAQTGGERGARYLQKILLKGIEGMSDVAGLSLARSGFVESTELLTACLADGRASVLVPTLMALRVSGRQAPCSTLRPLLRHPDGTVRFHAVHASNDAGCLDQKAIVDLSKDERDSSVRALLTDLGSAVPRTNVDRDDQRGHQ